MIESNQTNQGQTSGTRFIATIQAQQERISAFGNQLAQILQVHYIQKLEKYLFSEATKA